MNKDQNGFSLVIIVIFMSIAALFIGYLAGSWLTSFLVDEDKSKDLANKAPKTEKISQNSVPKNQKEQTVNNSQNNLTAPTAKEKKEKTANSTKTQNKSQSSNSDQEQKTLFAVQVGAFSDYNNAVLLKDEIEKLGFKVKITDSSPHQVQVVNYSSRTKAESVEKELEAKGYKGFIVHLE